MSIQRKILLALICLLVCLMVNACAPVSSSSPTSLAATPTPFSPTATSLPTRIAPTLTLPYPIPSATSTTAPSPTPTMRASPTPTPTRDAAYEEFARQLKTAIESNDEATLRRLISPRLSFGRYRSDGAQTKTIGEAIGIWRSYRASKSGGSFVLDLERPVLTMGQQLLGAFWTVRLFDTTNIDNTSGCALNLSPAAMINAHIMALGFPQADNTD